MSPSDFIAYQLAKLNLENRNQATLQEQKNFLTLWECICGTCFVCKACLQVVKKLQSEEEE